MSNIRASSSKLGLRNGYLTINKELYMGFSGICQDENIDQRSLLCKHRGCVTLQSRLTEALTHAFKEAEAELEAARVAVIL